MRSVWQREELDCFAGELAALGCLSTAVLVSPANYSPIGTVQEATGMYTELQDYERALAAKCVCLCVGVLFPVKPLTFGGLLFDIRLA